MLAGLHREVELLVVQLDPIVEAEDRDHEGPELEDLDRVDGSDAQDGSVLLDLGAILVLAACPGEVLV